MRHGVVPVTTPVGCVSQFIVNEKNGFIFDFDDLESQHAAIFRLFNDRALLRDIKWAAAATELPTWEQAATILCDIYNAMIL